NAVRLVLTLLDAAVWKDELPRIVRGAVGRQQRGAWDLTVANAWGVLALEKFAREYERTPVAGVSTAALAGAPRSLDWAAAPRVGRGLGGESTIAAGGESSQGWAWPAYQERAFDAFRAYYRFVPKGTLTVEYTVRLNQAGRFVLPPTRVEALYAPEMFGELP